MDATRKTVQVASSDVNVLIIPTEHGYSCQYDRMRNPGDNPGYLNTEGEGKTVALAMTAYIRQCYAQEQQDFEMSMSDDNFRSR